MSLLNVSALQNVGASGPNIVLNTDGSVTLPVYTNTTTPPAVIQAGTLWFDGTSLQIRNTANTTWVAVSGGATGSFQTADIPAKTVTVVNGLITSIV